MGLTRALVTFRFVDGKTLYANDRELPATAVAAAAAQAPAAPPPPAEKVSERWSVLEVAMRTQAELGEGGGTQLPCLASAIRALRVLKKSANEAKHVWRRDLAETTAEQVVKPTQSHAEIAEQQQALERMVLEGLTAELAAIKAKVDAYGESRRSMARPAAPLPSQQAPEPKVDARARCEDRAQLKTVAECRHLQKRSGARWQVPRPLRRAPPSRACSRAWTARSELQSIEGMFAQLVGMKLWDIDVVQMTQEMVWYVWRAGCHRWHWLMMRPTWRNRRRRGGQCLWKRLGPVTSVRP